VVYYDAASDARSLQETKLSRCVQNLLHTREKKICKVD